MMTTNDENLMTQAERELHARIVEVLQVTAEGPQLDGAIVANVESLGMCEDEKTLAVTVELADGRLAMFQFAPGSSITAHVVA